MTSPVAEQPPVAPPVAERRPQTTEHHGRTRTDDYDWLRAKGTPEVTAYLEAENAWTAARTDHLAGLRESIFGEIKARVSDPLGIFAVVPHPAKALRAVLVDHNLQREAEGV